MIKLFQCAPAFGLPNASPFCMKLEIFGAVRNQGWYTTTLAVAAVELLVAVYAALGVERRTVSGTTSHGCSPASARISTAANSGVLRGTPWRLHLLRNAVSAAAVFSP